MSPYRTSSPVVQDDPSPGFKRRKCCLYYPPFVKTKASEHGKSWRGWLKTCDHWILRRFGHINAIVGGIVRYGSDGYADCSLVPPGTYCSPTARTP